MKSAPSLWFEPARSRIGIAASFVVGLLAVGAVVSSGLPPDWRLGAAVAVSILWARGLRAQSIESAPRCVLQPEGDWLVTSANVETRAALICSHDLGFLIALQFRTDRGARIDLVLWPDSLSSETRRRLRVWLGRQGGLR
ncbi:MAG: hypothetical protein HYV17_15135 [Xanthomonadales bacterium]|nr:hypothetical protein [Xanthomonadales bacterium]